MNLLSFPDPESLVAELNDHTRFTAMPMRGHGNVAGADSTLTWATASWARGATPGIACG